MASGIIILGRGSAYKKGEGVCARWKVSSTDLTQAAAVGGHSRRRLCVESVSVKETFHVAQTPSLALLLLRLLSC